MTPNRGSAGRAPHAVEISVAVKTTATLPHAYFNDKATPLQLDKAKVVLHTNSTFNPT